MAFHMIWRVHSIWVAIEGLYYIMRVYIIIYYVDNNIYYTDYNIYFIDLQEDTPREGSLH